MRRTARPTVGARSRSPLRRPGERRSKRSDMNKDPPNELNDVELYRRIASADGPVITNSADIFRRAVEVLADRYDGKLTDARVTRVVYPESPWDVWFSAEEADILLRGVSATDALEMTHHLPYEGGSAPCRSLVDAMCWWPEGTKV